MVLSSAVLDMMVLKSDVKLHSNTPLPPDAISLTSSPQILAGPEMVNGDVDGLTVTVMVVLLLHLFGLVTVTEYTPDSFPMM